MSIVIPTFNLKGEKVGEFKTDSILFTTKINPALVHEVYVMLSNRMRQNTAHTKTRGEVRGGGKKPWKQKGTGRARHGSIRSPIWVGGGVTFGPRKDRSYDRKINKKAMRAALRMIFTDHAVNGRLLIVEDWSTEGKAKPFSAMLKGMGILGSSVLVIAPAGDTAAYRAARNIAKVDVLPANEVNAVELLQHRTFVANKEAITALEKLFVK